MALFFAAIDTIIEATKEYQAGHPQKQKQPKAANHTIKN
jgi:hypothetical protein